MKDFMWQRIAHWPDATRMLKEYEQHAKGYRRRPSKILSSTWAPVMTEQQRKKPEQYVKDNQLPF